MRFLHRRGGSGTGLLGVAAGFLAGVLVASLVVADDDTNVVSDGTAGTVDTSVGLGDAAATGGDGAAGAGVEGASGTGGSASVDQGSGGSGGGAVTGGGGDAGSSGGSASRNVRGVTADSITIGVAMPDTEWLKALDEDYYAGNIQKMVEAAVQQAEREGKLTVHGRTLRFVYRYNSMLDAGDQRASCVSFIQEHKVFAVIAIGEYGVGVQCVAREFKTPMLAEQTANWVSDSIVQAGKPFLFYPHMSSSRHTRNWIAWAHARGILKGKKIGLYYSTSSAGGDPDESRKIIESQLEKYGYSLSEVHVTSSVLGGPDDQIAVQKFRSAGVTMAIIPMSPTPMGNFMEYAQAQGYKPTYITGDFAYQTVDFTAENLPAEQFDKSYGLSSRHSGAFGGKAFTPKMTECVANYERISGDKISKTRMTSPWQHVLKACDQLELLLLGLDRAGRDLTPLGFVGGLETIRDLPLRWFGNVTFTKDKHDGESSMRTLQWDAASKAYKLPDGPAFQPLLEP